MFIHERSLFSHTYWRRTTCSHDTCQVSYILYHTYDTTTAATVLEVMLQSVAASCCCCKMRKNTKLRWIRKKARGYRAFQCTFKPTSDSSWPTHLASGHIAARRQTCSNAQIPSHQSGAVARAESWADPSLWIVRELYYTHMNTLYVYTPICPEM